VAFTEKSRIFWFLFVCISVHSWFYKRSLPSQRGCDLIRTDGHSCPSRRHATAKSKSGHRSNLRVPRQQKCAQIDKPNRQVNLTGWAKPSDSDDRLTILRDSPTIFSPLVQTFASVIAMKEACVVTELRVVTLVALMLKTWLEASQRCQLARFCEIIE
jgi:hypothetical protein